jgi:mercuric ion binding protein
VATLALATERTIVLNVGNATCALCGPIVKGSLERVAGVMNVTVEDAPDLLGAVATVRFDDEATGVEDLIAATTNAGYPSHLAD